jgi:hypothetical protein
VVLRGQADDRPSVAGGERVAGRQQRVGAKPKRRGEGGSDGLGADHFHRRDGESQLLGDGSRFVQREKSGGKWRVEEHGDVRDSRRELLEELQPLGRELLVRQRHPGDVAAGARQARDEPDGHRITGFGHDDWNGRRRSLGRQRRGAAGHDDDIDVPRHQLRRERVEPVHLLGRVAALEDDGLSFHVAEVAQAPNKSVVKVRAEAYPDSIRQPADLRDLPRRLRPRGQRRNECAGQRGQQEAAPIHTTP